MPELTRRRDHEARGECWHVYYGDVRVGTLAERIGNPNGTPGWQWSCGFYPGGVHNGDRSGTSDSLDEARAAFDQAWQDYLPRVPAGGIDEWRHERDWTAQKYAMWERGELLPSQKPSSMMTCPCGERFDSHHPPSSQIHVPHITAHEAERERRRRHG